MLDEKIQTEMKKSIHKYSQLQQKQKLLWNLVSDNLQCTLILSWVYHNNTDFVGNQAFSVYETFRNGHQWAPFEYWSRRYLYKHMNNAHTYTDTHSFFFQILPSFKAYFLVCMTNSLIPVQGNCCLCLCCFGCSGWWHSYVWKASGEI